MKAVRNKSASLSDARQLEQRGQPEDAAGIYEQLAAADPLDEDAVGRLLIVYRRLRAYKKELGVIDRALEAISERDIAMQRQWLTAHPGAAKLGKDVLRSLGGEASSYGADAFATQLSKRRMIVQKRLGGNSAKHRPTGKKMTAAERMRIESEQKRAETERRQAEKERKRAEAKGKRALAEAERKQAEAERKRAEAERKQAEAERKRAKAAARKAANADRKRQAQPSLFVITLRYLVPLGKIDAAMDAHVAFLDKHFKSGDFLVAGRQVPRTGGVIVASVKDRAAAQRIAEEDPFLKKKLASVDITEFKAGTVGPVLRQWLAKRR